jgi:hypothetical protein
MELAARPGRRLFGAAGARAAARGWQVRPTRRHLDRAYLDPGLEQFTACGSCAGAAAGCPACAGSGRRRLAVRPHETGAVS